MYRHPPYKFDATFGPTLADLEIMQISDGMNLRFPEELFS